MNAFQVLALTLDQLAGAIRPLTPRDFSRRERATSSAVGGSKPVT